MNQLMPVLNAAGTAYEPHPADLIADSVGALAQRYSSGNVANATATAIIPAVAGETCYITRLEVYAGGATAAALVDITVAGLLGGSITFPFSVPAGATLAASPLIVQLPKPLPASAVNTQITVTCPALGAGNTKAQVVAFGFTR